MAITKVTRHNTPAFYAYQSSDQTIANTTTTIVVFDTEVLDTNSNFASNTFTPTTAGKYSLTMSVSVYSNAVINACLGSIFKNTTEIARNASHKPSTSEAGGYHTQTQTVIAEANGSGCETVCISPVNVDAGVGTINIEVLFLRA